MLGAILFFGLTTWLVAGLPFGLAALAYGQFKIAAYILLPGFILLAVTFSGLMALVT
jgi:hypothetical protein